MNHADPSSYVPTIVAGSRDFKDHILMKHILDAFQQKIAPKELLIISGRAEGADKMGEEYAKAHGLHYAMVPALWSVHNKAAGPFRNAAMAALASHLIAFPTSPSSRGTKAMIEIALRSGITTYVVTPIFHKNTPWNDLQW